MPGHTYPLRLPSAQLLAEKEKKQVPTTLQNCGKAYTECFYIQYFFDSYRPLVK
jgi:hypothetical protein